MDPQHASAKIYVDGDLTVDPARFIDVFHGWIKESSLDELLIDVADYRHVPAGPGVLLIAHEADYSMDNAGGRWGLLYNRKAPLDGTAADCFRQALSSAAMACCLLEDELAGEGPLRFSRHQFDLSINDRALAPNTPETYAAVKPVLEGLLSEMLGHDDFTLSHQSDPRRLFGVAVKVAKPYDLPSLSEAAE